MADEFAPTTEIPDSQPKWVFYFGCLLVAIGTGAGLLGVVAPTQFFSDFPNFTQWPEISYVTTGWGIRNLAMDAAMLFALWIKTPSVIGMIFSMRFLTELGDLLNTPITGHSSLGIPLAVLATVWTVAFLIPEALAARWGITRELKCNEILGSLLILTRTTG